MAKRKNAIDELAELRAFIKDLKTKESTLADKVEGEYGFGTHEGTKATATVFESERNTVAWKDLAMKLGAKPAQIKRATKTTVSTVVRITPKLAR